MTRMSEEEFIEEERERLQDELDDANREIDNFWMLEDADEMEDTYGDLIDRRDEIQSKLYDLR